MKDKVYVFFKQITGDKEPKRIEKFEVELTKPEKDLLFGVLLQQWNNTPLEIQAKFLNRIKKG